jgi:hypothetical protein
VFLLSNLELRFYPLLPIITREERGIDIESQLVSVTCLPLSPKHVHYHFHEAGGRKDQKHYRDSNLGVLAQLSLTSFLPTFTHYLAIFRHVIPKHSPNISKMVSPQTPIDPALPSILAVVFIKYGVSTNVHILCLLSQKKIVIWAF